MRGALHEIFAGDATAFGFAAASAGRAAGRKRLLWIVQDYSTLEHGAISPTGLAEFGIDPFSFLLLRVADATDALRAGVDALSCSALGAVIVEIPGNPKILDLVASRRLVLAAQSKGISVFLLRPCAEVEPSAAETRWLIRAAPSPQEDNWGMPRFDAELIRNRHGETGRWTMEWCCDDGVFRDPVEPGARKSAELPAAHPGVMAPTPADRPAAAAHQGWRRAG